MSTQSDPRKAEHESDNWRPASSMKRSRHRPYLIEWRYTGPHAWMRRSWGQWRKWGAYETAKRRDSALEQKRKDNGRRYGSHQWDGFEYRAVDPV